MPPAIQRLRRRKAMGKKEDDFEGLTSLSVMHMKERMGRITDVLDCRTDKTSNDAFKMEKPDVPAGQLYEESGWDLQTLMGGYAPGVHALKRPQEFAPNPVLFDAGMDRMDIGQGSVGDCWFLSILAALADKPDILKQVIPDGAWKYGQDNYDGVFHCRFWRFGEWIDVYVDDRLPVTNNKPFGARSASNENEMWVSLIEKAFARFHGGYGKIAGGVSGQAFITMTGGVAEYLKNGEHGLSEQEFFQRMRNCLNSGSWICCSVSGEDKCGLSGNHAYTMTGGARVTMTDGSKKRLLRIRNPWGGSDSSGKGEWKGAFSDDSSDWDHVCEADRKNYLVKDDDGEFYVTVSDYFSTFDRTDICNLTPDFDEDGKPDGLDYVTCIMGEWLGNTAAGNRERKLQNPKFVLSLPPGKVDENGEIPLVLQLAQNKRDRQDNQFFACRIDVFLILKEEGDNVVISDKTTFKTYMRAESITSRYSLPPGDYMLVPNTFQEGEEKQFIVRSFSNQDIGERGFSGTAVPFVSEVETDFVVEEEEFHMTFTELEMSGWKSGGNAGGQVGNNATYEKNPQLEINLQGDGEQILTVSLMQGLDGDLVAIGLRLYALTDETVPLDYRAIAKIYNAAPKSMEGQQGMFVMGKEAKCHYKLAAGRYMLLVFTDKPDTEKNFAIMLASDKAFTQTKHNF